MLMFFFVPASRAHTHTHKACTHAGLWGGSDAASIPPIPVVTSSSVEEILLCALLTPQPLHMCAALAPQLAYLGPCLHPARSADTRSCPSLQQYMQMAKETSHGTLQG